MGYSMAELMIVLGLIALLAAMAFPMIGNILGSFRLTGDVRDVANAVLLTRMQAASNFSRSRLYVDLSVNGYHTELKTPTTAWATVGNVTYLSSTNDSYSFGVVSTAPPNTQTTIANAPQCLNNASPPVAIANTACIVFNSRGIPIDSTGAPTGVDALYLTDGVSVFAVTVSTTSIMRTWRTGATSTPSWIRQ